MGASNVAGGLLSGALHMRPSSHWYPPLFALCIASALSSCGGAGDTTGPSGPSTPPVDLTKPTAISLQTAASQTVRVKSAVPAAITFKVTNAAGTGIGGVTVSFTVTAGGGSLAATSAPTGGDGTVAVPQWTVGTAVGANTVMASVGSALSATASVASRLPYWTVMVYMAADNTLAVEGVINLLQMAAAGVNPEVQVVVQGEFNPEAFAEAGCTATCADRSNFDTFRYVMDGSMTSSPNGVFRGPTTDIGSVNMTDPGVLRSFVQWGEQVAPAARNVLVLWNHGGDDAGLIEDETSAPGAVMSLAGLQTALSGLPTLDVLDFEMCLMAGYEPLSAVNGLASTVVASEEAQIVGGWDFTQFLKAMYTQPTASAVQMAGRLADAYAAGYADTPYSETVSAFNMAGFAAVDAAVNQFGAALGAAPTAEVSAIASGAAVAQRYEYQFAVDIADMTDSVRAHVGDPGVDSAAAALRQAVTAPAFLIANHAVTGTGYNVSNVARSEGLQIVMPAGSASALPSSGPFSLASYAAAFPGRAWTSFLQAWVPLTNSLRSFTDVGANRTTLWLVWDSTFVRRGNVEMLLLEPDGDLYGPAFGTISPSGLFSADAAADSAYYEGWESNRFVEVGKFWYLAWLVRDPTSYQPLVNVAYQVGSGPVTNLYGPGTYPRLSLSRSFLADPSATMLGVENGAYTDLQPVATWTTSAPSGALASVAPRTSEIAAPRSEDAGPALTNKQVAALKRVRATWAAVVRENPSASPGLVRRYLQEALRGAPPKH